MKHNFTFDTAFAVKVGISVLAFASLLQFGCGAGTVETKTGTGGTGIATPEIITEAGTTTGPAQGLNPLTIGGINFDDSTLEILLNANPGRTVTDLRLGMSAEVVGDISQKVGAGHATTAIVQSAVRGPVVYIDLPNQQFSVLGQNFYVDHNTILENITGLAALQSGDRVEIYASPREDARKFVVTRLIRTVTDTPTTPVEIVATATQISPTQIQVQGVDVDVSSAEIVPVNSTGFGSPRVNGAAVLGDSRVRVIGRQILGTIAASRILTGLDPHRTEGQLATLSGPLQGAKQGLLRVQDTNVDVSAIASLPLNLVVGNRVQVNGRVTASGVRAFDVKVMNPAELITYTLDGSIASYVSVASFRVRGEEINASSAIFSGGSPGDLAVGRRVLIKANAGPGALTATEVTILPAATVTSQNSGG